MLPHFEKQTDFRPAPGGRGELALTVGNAAQAQDLLRMDGFTYVEQLV